MSDWLLVEELIGRGKHSQQMLYWAVDITLVTVNVSLNQDADEFLWPECEIPTTWQPSCIS